MAHSALSTEIDFKQAVAAALSLGAGIVHSQGMACTLLLLRELRLVTAQSYDRRVKTVADSLQNLK